jgi:S-(hydroxymethyl)glutathione dehydrogenase / alcohol dehydrogenase
MRRPIRHLSRRDLLKRTVAASGAAVLTPASASPSALGQAPTVRTAQRFRGWVAPADGGRATLEELLLRPISGRQVVVRTEATNLDVGFAAQMLNLPRNPAPPPPVGSPAAAPPRRTPRAMIPGHGGVGVVTAVGPDVRRVQVGDRVCVSGTPQCGACYPCLMERSDMCQWNFRQDPNYLVPIADTRAGTPVYAVSHIGGLSEMMVTYEEWVVPLFTKADATGLGIVTGCTAVAGLGATTSQGVATIRPGGSVVAVVGCGPLGLSAVQGARIAGASTIIAIDPVRLRRDAALKVGATHALDPTAEGNGLVQKVRDISVSVKGLSDRLWSGGTEFSNFTAAGADFVVEAAGAENIVPKVERSPDPTGVLPIQQAYLMTSSIGHLVTTSLARGNVSLPANIFTIAGRTHHAGQCGGCNPLRDLPRFVAMLEKGQFDAKTLAERVVSIEHVLEAYEDIAYKLAIGGVMTAA